MAEDNKCPVNHTNANINSNNTGKSWYQKIPNLFWASGVLSTTGPQDKGACPVNHTSKSISNSAEEKCPVDSSAREEWLKKIKEAGGSLPANHPHISVQSNNSYDVEEAKSCSSSELPEKPEYRSQVNLPTDREISSIPRTGEKESKWIYPSQKQFFEAMQRKNWKPEASDMGTVVPIHNAVNERAWRLIQWWEKGQGGENCGGIQLTSFKGDSKKLTPRARWRLFLGYEKPFDRHDWLVNRCGKEIEYVIDFYSGKQDEKSQVPSFFLDVRPKLNSVEGWKLRISKALGF